MKRLYLEKYFAVWEDLPASKVVWFEAGIRWAEGLIEGNWWERTGRLLVLSAVNPLLASAMEMVLQTYRGKLKRHIGEQGIWVALQLPAGAGVMPRVYAKKRNASNSNTKKNASHPPTPWDPPAWNVF